MAENIYYVYQYIREDGTPYYIGKGCGKRMYSKQSRRCGVPSDKDRIQVVKDNLSEKDAFSLEKELIEFYGRKDKGTGILVNFTDGGEGTSGHKVSEETKRKISSTRNNWSEVQKEEYSEKVSAATVGKKRNEDTKKLLSEIAFARTTNPMTGRKHSEETKQKIREKRKLQVMSEETKKKISESHMGEKNSFFGKKHSEETKKKISDTKKRKVEYE